MKKILFLFLIIVLLSFITPQKEETEKDELRGIYISYIEISRYLKDKSEEESKKTIEGMIHNSKEFGLNTILLQVRPSCDSLYDSNIFPLSKYLTDHNTYPYDVLEYFLEVAHKNDIAVMAWINPYRISTTGTKEDIPVNSPAYPYKDTRMVYEKNGVYWNPAKKEVEKIIVEGVKEILEYPVDGILMDDYFYPGEDVDLEEYEEENLNISLEEYRLKKINEMVKAVHRECQKKNIIFGISPDGNMENNYHKNYADVKEWLEKEEYIDFIMPQLYYGFENTTKPFIETSNEWNNLIKNDIPLYPVLAFYKVGKEDMYAKEGYYEWMNRQDMIRNELIHIRSLSHYKGFVFYRYDNLFLEESFTKTSKAEKESVKKLLKEFQKR